MTTPRLKAQQKGVLLGTYIYPFLYYLGFNFFRDFGEQINRKKGLSLKFTRQSIFPTKYVKRMPALVSIFLYTQCFGD